MTKRNNNAVIKIKGLNIKEVAITLLFSFYFWFCFQRLLLRAALCLTVCADVLRLGRIPASYSIAKAREDWKSG
jgi:hypothetical protein